MEFFNFLLKLKLVLVQLWRAIGIESGAPYLGAFMWRKYRERDDCYHLGKCTDFLVLFPCV